MRFRFSFGGTGKHIQAIGFRFLTQRRVRELRIQTLRAGPGGKLT